MLDPILNMAVPSGNQSMVAGILQQATEESMDVEMEDMEYEDPDQQRQERRGSMTETEEKERRASIKAIMADPTVSPMTKRRSIQHLMDGRRNSLNASQHSTVASTPDTSFESQPSVAVPLGVAYQNDMTRRAEQTRPPCTHYARNCSLIAPCCGACFGCRICHDDCPVLPQPLNRKITRSSSLPSSFTSMDVTDDTHHTIDRFAIAEVICRNCFTRQNSKTNNCITCGIQFGGYHCNICNLWMNDQEQPFHCHDCGFCRVGGAHNFQHCNACGMCIDKNLYHSHNCQSGKYRSNCPVCQEYLFSSRSASHEMPCGHAIHWDCFRQLAAHDSRCPVCKKTAETRERMIPTWEAMAAGVALQPVPPELSRVVNISCNDCERGEEARAWHFLGVQCNNCQSFNTVVDQILMAGEEAYQFLEMRDAQNMVNEEQSNNPRRKRRRRVNRRRSAF